MLIDPMGKIMGMDAMLPYFRVLPFADILFTDFFSGLALLIVNGLTNLAAALLSAKKRTELRSIQCKTGEYKKELSDGRKYAKNAE